MVMALLLGCGKSDSTPEEDSSMVSTQGSIKESEPPPASIEPEIILEPITEPLLEPISEQEPMPEPGPMPKPELEPEPVPVKPPTPTIGLDLNAAQIVWEGTGTEDGNQIALTFDAGWEFDNALSILDVLDQYQVKATFFLRGGWVKDHPNIAQEIVNRGHIVGNHSQAHGHMNDMMLDEVTDDITESTALIKGLIGYTPDLFRPPYGEYNNRLLNVLGEQGYQYAVMWTIDSHDWAETMNGFKVTETYLIDRVLNRATDNGIVLMHVGGYQTVNALPEIITGLRAKGYELVTLYQLIP